MQDAKAAKAAVQNLFEDLEHARDRIGALEALVARPVVEVLVDAVRAALSPDHPVRGGIALSIGALAKATADVTGTSDPELVRATVRVMVRRGEVLARGGGRSTVYRLAPDDGARPRRPRRKAVRS